MELEPELERRLFDLSDVRLRIRIGRIDEQAHDRGVRYCLMQHLQSDGRGHGGKECHAGDITTRLVGTLDKPKLNGVAADPEYDWDVRRGGFRRHSRWGVTRMQDNYSTAHQIGGERRQSLIVVAGESIVSGNIDPFTKAHAAEALAKRCFDLRQLRTAGHAQIPYDRHPRLLRARRHRPSCCATEKRDELAAFHRHSI